MDAKNRMIRGTNGRLWVDGKLMSQVKSFEAKLTMNYEEVDTNGDFVTKHVYDKCSVAGTMSLFKIDSFMMSELCAAALTGVMPDITVIAKVTDPNVKGSQRVQLGGVQFTELTMAQFENGTVTEEDLPFTAESYTVLEVIAG